MRQIYKPDGFSPTLTEKCLHWIQTGETGQFTELELLALRVFIQSDQSGAEALIVAYESDPADYRQLFIHNVKPHVYVALKLFKDIWKKKLKDSGGLTEGLDIDALCNTPIRELKSNPFWSDIDQLIKSSDNWSAKERYYYLAKQTVHSFSYDVQGPTFRMNILEKSEGQIYITNEDACNFLLTIRALFPEVPERNRRIEKQARETKLLFNLFGHPFIITDYNFDKKLKELYAWSSQSTVGEITRIATTNLFEQEIVGSNKPYDILADTHDSYLVQCPLLFVKECRDSMRRYMNIDLVSPNDGTKFKMKSEQNIGYNWNSAKASNPLGLQELKWL
jgi:hypothetical protein